MLTKRFATSDAAERIEAAISEVEGWEAKETCNGLCVQEYEGLAAEATDTTAREPWLLRAKEFRAIAGERLETLGNNSDPRND